ncbi:tryptophan halogenase family protein (plasmid) [Alteromonas marina]|uniref:tryptophan halogenase family protein n=1 Tax=Alteromonas sp. KUL150 TaxID=2480805 RepID=UPI0012E5DDDC|nr:tryptophan halogenase family protein [Alteromonas sp. KUL150]GFD73745.1 tryptophan halogenase [Tenacibaculum sp. KUL113]GFD87597.1 tryptophan halogenase [Alteromonas sp. KUL150]
MFKAPTHQIRNIVILGGGTAGWMTAAALSTLLDPKFFSITLVESDAIGTVGVGEATLPHLRFFNQRLGIDEGEFIKATNATIKAGIEFSNWGDIGDTYIHPFGDYGKPIKNVAFHHYFFARKKYNNQLKLDDYSLPVVACKNSKFNFPTSEPGLLTSSYSYAYHIDAGLYAQYLRTFSEQKGTTRIEGKVNSVSLRKSDGSISGLKLDDGTIVNGDFFVDCSGFKGRLIEQSLKAGYEDWSHWLPCDRAIAVQSEHNGRPLPYTKAIARDAGWQWQIPLKHRMGNGYVYASQYINEENALKTLLTNLPGNQTSEPNYLKFVTGKRKSSWLKNCVAIGLSSGFLEPLESTSIYLIQAAIMKLVELLPQRENMAVKSTEYNRYFSNEMDKIRDFLILHYHATSREDTPFWTFCKHLKIPPSLEEKMELYKEIGVIEDYQYGLFLTPSWLAVYNGQGVIPSYSDIRVNETTLAHADTYMLTLFTDIQQAVARMQTNEQIVSRLHDNMTCNVKLQLNQAAQFSLYGRK